MIELHPDFPVMIADRVATFAKSYKDAVDRVGIGGMFDDTPQLAELFEALFLADYAKMHRSETDIEIEKMQLRIVDESVGKHLENAPKRDKFARMDLEQKAAQKKDDFKTVLLNKGLPEEQVQRFVADFFNLVHITSFAIVNAENRDTESIKKEAEMKKQHLEDTYPEVFEALTTS